MADGAAVMLAGLLRGGRAGRAAAASGAVARQTSVQQTVLLRGVLGCNDVGGAAALSAGSCAAGEPEPGPEARLPADRAAARQTGLLRCGRSCGAAGGAFARRAPGGAAVLLAGLMLRTVPMRGGLGGGRCCCAAGEGAAWQTELVHCSVTVGLDKTMRLLNNDSWLPNRSDLRPG